MSALTFLNLFRRFCVMYSFPRTVISDNGSNFVAGAKVFKEMLDHTNVSEYMTGNSITCKFIGPRAPWMGGFYERMISLTKSCLKKVLYKKKVTREELEIILREVQTRLNNRPLTYLNKEGPVESLTPNHLLYGRTINPYPLVVTLDTSDPDFLGHTELIARHSCLSSIINHFERIWKKDYLTSLREKHYGSSKPMQMKPPKVGEMVIVERLGPQHEWPLGRIV
ncbi:uncharacterized protein LOC143027402 [Oratosquilla oratoria]|uniref:uncharacterized protein LOC143027402 n=1 Tax=Oratosquilla oratoria TaxID=337810 RepID=UPI003F770084